MYNIIKIKVHENDELFPYLLNIGKLSNNLYNASLFRVRQIMTSKDKDVLTKHQIEILNEVETMNAILSSKNKAIREFNNSRVINYYFLNDLMKLNQNVDYCHLELPCHTAQHILKNVCSNMKSFFESNQQYKKDNTNFTNKPKLPNYKRKNGISSFVFSNQECVIRQNKKGNFYVKLPKTKLTVRLPKKINGRLKEVQVNYINNTFNLNFVLEDGKEISSLNEASTNICAIDLGLDNIMAVTNNIDIANQLYKGTVLKSINHLYNKKIANMVSETTKGTTNKYIPSKRYYAITEKRNNRIKDIISKATKQLITWCVENRIDTIVIGSNKLWKQELNIGKRNNQNFVQIPYDLVKRNIRYRAEREGLRYIETEESYTSKASFLDKDTMPIYKKEDENKPVFSGKRIKRGLYQSKDKTIINADLNGSANIMRKVFGDDVTIRFDQINVIRSY